MLTFVLSVLLLDASYRDTKEAFKDFENFWKQASSTEKTVVKTVVCGIGVLVVAAFLADRNKKSVSQIKLPQLSLFPQSTQQQPTSQTWGQWMLDKTSLDLFAAMTLAVQIASTKAGQTGKTLRQGLFGLTNSN